MDDYCNDKTSDGSEQPEIATSLQLAFVGSVLATIGDGLTAVAALLAIEEAAAAAQTEKQDQAASDKRLDDMQEQIDRLERDISRLKGSRR